MKALYAWLAVVAVLTIAVECSEAGCRRTRTTRGSPQSFAPTPTAKWIPTYAPWHAPGAETSGILARVNAWRAAHGRGPLAWDATLAAFAAGNNGIHSPGSSGGASQCWAATTDASQAFEQWVHSPPHALILLNAQSAIGISTCSTGCTANAR